MAEVTLSQVWKTYPDNTVAVRDVSMAVRDGEFVVLVGPSGCGKSTTLRMIAGLEAVTRGEISIGGRVVNDLPPRDRDIAMVFQSYALYPQMTVYENMAFGLRVRKTPRKDIDARVRDAADVLGLTGLLSRRPRHLSGGQRQRVALGRAIVRQPRVFLFDEPLSNLDARLRTSTRAELKALHQRLGVTTVYVTHDQEEAMTLADRIVVMAGGVTQQIAPPLEAFDLPANRFAAGFIGTPAMNFLEGTIQSSNGKDTFVPDRAPDVKLPFDTALTGSISGDRRVVLGVRPTSIELHRSRAGAPGSLPATVSVIEPLGDRMDVLCDWAGREPIRTRVASDAELHVGDMVSLTVAPASCHWFEPGEFGARLST